MSLFLSSTFFFELFINFSICEINSLIDSPNNFSFWISERNKTLDSTCIKYNIKENLIVPDLIKFLTIFLAIWIKFCLNEESNINNMFIVSYLYFKENNSSNCIIVL